MPFQLTLDFSHFNYTIQEAMPLSDSINNKTQRHHSPEWLDSSYEQRVNTNARYIIYQLDPPFPHHLQLYRKWKVNTA